MPTLSRANHSVRLTGLTIEKGYAALCLLLHTLRFQRTSSAPWAVGNRGQWKADPLAREEQLIKPTSNLLQLEHTG